MIEQNLRVRFATISDTRLLAELAARTFVDTYADENDPDDIAAYLAASFSPQIQANQLANLSTTVLIAEIYGMAVGYAHLHRGTAPSIIHSLQPMELVRLYAEKCWVGQGIGSALMSACLDVATAQGCDTIWLSVWERNLRAIAFYHKWGFSSVGTQLFQVGQDLQTDFLMLRSVRAEQ